MVVELSIVTSQYSYFTSQKSAHMNNSFKHKNSCNVGVKLFLMLEGVGQPVNTE